MASQDPANLSPWVSVILSIQETTLTCCEESLADEMKRPLFAISEHNLQLWSKSEGFSYDNALQHAFKCAHRWKALMFIDEADNFVIRNPRLTDVIFMGKVISSPGYG
jgi:hypothetical protein